MFINRGYFLSLKQRYKARVRSLSNRITQFWRLHQTGLTALAYLGVSVMLGGIAYHLSQEEAIAQWEQRHLPSKRVLESVLASLCLEPVSRPSIQEKLLRFLPSTHEEIGAFWSSVDPVCVSVFLESHDSTGGQATLYCKGIASHFKSPHSLPQDWQFLGIGWRGLDRLAQSTDQKCEKVGDTLPIQPAESHRSEPGKKRIRGTVPVLDSRELQY